MDIKDVQVVTIGSDMMPLLTGQVDVVTGWLTNTTALKVLGPDRVDLRLWDTGVHLYAGPYYAPITDTLSGKRDMLVRFMRAASRGWAFAYANRDEAIEQLMKEFPNLNAADERAAAGRDAVVLLRRQHTKLAGYAAARWIRRCGRIRSIPGAQLGQFASAPPKLDEVMTLDILNATQDSPAESGLMSAVVQARSMQAAVECHDVTVRFISERRTVHRAGAHLDRCSGRQLPDAARSRPAAW